MGSDINQTTDMPDSPINLRVTLEGVRMNVLHHMRDSHEEIAAEIEKQVTAYLTPERVAAQIKEEVETVLPAAISTSLKDLFRYGKGRALIDQMVEHAVMGALSKDDG